MHRTFIALGLLAVLALPAVASAKPSREDRRDARRECRALRGDTEATRNAFKERYGSFGKCVSSRARGEERERKVAKSNAARSCRAERNEIGREAFAAKYGTNANKKNAFGKCVSAKARAREKADDARDLTRIRKSNGARECRVERGTTSTSRAAFAQKYGTNPNKKNAFGKCVSAKAHASS